ncbi:hypothetical protein [Thiohalorhabdus sp.]|uniref:hypothetical protein n=1 Tax=Thiohalorhabdus sp. TaxID=3094134 RepID=UPI002FC38F74
MTEHNPTDSAGSRTEAEEESTFDASCAFQEATDFASRFTRLGLEAAATPLAWLPDPAREQLRHTAGEALRGLAVAPRVVSGVLDELAREVEVPVEETDLGSRRRAESGEDGSAESTGKESG